MDVIGWNNRENWMGSAESAGKFPRKIPKVFQISNVLRDLWEVINDVLLFCRGNGGKFKLFKNIGVIF